MTITDDYSFGTTATMIDCMTDDDIKEMLDDIEADNYLSSIEAHDSKFV